MSFSLVESTDQGGHVMIKQMQYFIKVVETNSFTKAAEECFISQSAISQQIKALEDELGVKLMNRKGRSFQLTPAGEFFYHNCQDIVKRVGELVKKTQEIDEDENVLKIGFLRSYNGQDLQEAILEFSNLYPQIEINVVKGNHEELYELLKSNKVSLVISDQRRAFHEDYFNYHLLHLDCFIEIAKANPLSNKDGISLDELTNETCILVVAPDQEATEREFYEHMIGIRTKYIFVRDLEEAKLMININRGFMPVEGDASGDSKYVAVIPLLKEGKQIQRNYCAFWKKNRTNYYIEEFAELLRLTMRQSHDE